MSDQKVKTLKTVRGKDVKIRYTHDNLEEALIGQRLFYDQNEVLLSPATAKLLERQVATNDPTIAQLGERQPRHVAMCFGSIATLSGESNFTVMIPYHPGDASHYEHLKEMFSYSSSSQNLNPQQPLKISYHGENTN
jgi:hypothetical protein